MDRRGEETRGERGKRGDVWKKKTEWKRIKIRGDEMDEEGGRERIKRSERRT